MRICKQQITVTPHYHSLHLDLDNSRSNIAMYLGPVLSVCALLGPAAPPEPPDSGGEEGGCCDGGGAAHVGPAEDLLEAGDLGQQHAARHAQVVVRHQPEQHREEEEVQGDSWK